MLVHTARTTLHDLFNQSQPELEGFLYKRTRCWETSADLCQEAFKQVCQLEDLTKINNLKAYLYRTALNLLCDHIRKQHIRGETGAAWPDEALPEGRDDLDAEAFVQAQQELGLILVALKELPPLCQRVFYLNRFDGLKQKEIAEQLGISVRSVEHNLKRALLHCAKALAKS